MNGNGSEFQATGNPLVDAALKRLSDDYKELKDAMIVQAHLNSLFEDEEERRPGLSLVKPIKKTDPLLRSGERNTPAKLARKQAKLYKEQHPNDLVAIIPEKLEEPYSINDAAPLWGQSKNATRNFFKKVSGVQLIPSPTHYVKGKKVRKYVTVLIPPSVLRREIQARTKA